MSFCLKDIQRVSAAITCSTSFGILCRYSKSCTIFFFNHHHQIETFILSLSLSGFLQLSVRDSCHSGLSQRCRCWKPRGNSSCSHDHLVTKRWCLKICHTFTWLLHGGCNLQTRVFPCRWNRHDGKNPLRLAERVGSCLCDTFDAYIYFCSSFFMVVVVFVFSF